MDPERGNQKRQSKNRGRGLLVTRKGGREKVSSQHKDCASRKLEMGGWERGTPRGNEGKRARSDRS